MRTFYQWCGDQGRTAARPAGHPAQRAAGSPGHLLRPGLHRRSARSLRRHRRSAARRAVRRLVTEPLGMTGTGYNLAGAPGRFAATERRADGTCWTGVVHDENARLMGGVAGHAGLFSDRGRPGPVRRLVGQCRGRPSARAAAPRGRVQPDRRAGRLPRAGLGCAGDRFDVLGGAGPRRPCVTPASPAPASPCDSPSGAWVILLTNAVHFGRDNSAVKALRRNLHTAVATALLD